MAEISDVAIVKTECSDKTYQPPRGLPFKTTGSYETDKEAYLNRRDTLYHKNTVAWRKSTGKVLKAVKTGTSSPSDEVELDKVTQKRRNLTTLDRFFDIRSEC